jgi:predicted RNA-binding protein
LYIGVGEMCELKVIIENEVKFENVIYAKSIDKKVIVSDIFGKSMEFENCQILEVNIGKEKLILTSNSNH